uniref:Uncharacterized protein n=1 Tax=Ciona savignyi TaxID=51511 RepID=H2ZGP7_CIOSA
MPNQPAKRTLSKAEKIQRLRIAVAKYSYTPASSDDESLISDGNGSDDEDPSWLNDSDTDSSLSSLGSVKKSKFVSSTASHANKKSDANGRQDLSEDSQASTRYNGANNDISTPESPKSAAHERPPVDNEKKVGAMLSMWENKKVKPKSAFDASEDDAFDNSTKGRLHGAKALFENMTKNPKTYSSSVENEIETTGITGSKKSLFENLAKSPQRAEPQTHSPKKPPSVHSSDYDVDDVTSDDSLSSASSSE